MNWLKLFCLSLSSRWNRFLFWRLWLWAELKVCAIPFSFSWFSILFTRTFVQPSGKRMLLTITRFWRTCPNWRRSIKGLLNVVYGTFQEVWDWLFCEHLLWRMVLNDETVRTIIIHISEKPFCFLWKIMRWDWALGQNLFHRLDSLKEKHGTWSLMFRRVWITNLWL